MGAHLLGKIQAAGVEDRLHALLQQAGLFGGAGGGQDAGAGTLGHLHSGLTHAARSRMDQHGFAMFEAGEALQAVDRGEKGRAHAGPLGRGERRRQRHAQLGAGGHMAGQASHRQGRHHPGAHQGQIHPRPHRRDGAHRFPTQGHLGGLIEPQLTAVGPQQAQGIEHIAKIEARRLHRKLEFTGG